MIKYLLNLKKDAPDDRDHVVAPVKLNTVVQVKYPAPYIKDQGMEGSCSGNMITEQVELLYRMHPSVLAKTFDVNTLRLSPQFVYGQTRIAEGDFNQDAGADLRTVYKVMSKIGCCLESSDPYNDRKAFVPATQAQIDEATKFKIGAYHRIYDAETAKSVLVSGYTIGTGIPVYPQFQSDEALATGMIRLPKKGQSPLGGHALHILGADDTQKVFGETGAFWVQNSWDVEWGIKGYCWIPYTYFKVLHDWDMWTCHFGKPW